jgi:hypothetical protein
MSCLVTIAGALDCCCATAYLTEDPLSGLRAAILSIAGKLSTLLAARWSWMLLPGLVDQPWPRPVSHNQPGHAQLATDQSQPAQANYNKL